jgi:hypothetical protein
MPTNSSFESDRLASLLNIDGTAAWRERKAEQYPHDNRNANAANLLRELEPEIGALNGGPLHIRIESFVDDENFGSEVDFIMRAVGFHFCPASGEELLKDIIRQLELRCKPARLLYAVS